MFEALALERIWNISEELERLRKTHDLGRIHMNFKAQRKTQDLKWIQKTGKNLRLRKVLRDLERISQSQSPKYFKTLPKSYKFCPSLINSSQVSYETWEGFIKLGKNLKYFERIWNTLKEFEILWKNLKYLERIWNTWEEFKYSNSKDLGRIHKTWIEYI